MPSKIPTNRSDLMAMGATCIVAVNSLPLDRDVRLTTRFYTELSVWWVDADRPYITVIEGLCGPAADDDALDKFAAETHGTLDSALARFEPSNLRDELVSHIPDDVAASFPDANALRAARAKKRKGYAGEAAMLPALRWLYEDETSEPTVLARKAAPDLNVSWRAIYDAMKAETPGGWAKAFLVALRHFDRSSWNASRETVDG